MTEEHSQDRGYTLNGGTLVTDFPNHPQEDVIDLGDRSAVEPRTGLGEPREEPVNPPAVGLDGLRR